MPPRAQVLRLILLPLALFVATATTSRAYEPATTPSLRPFHFETDTFAFANETVWHYVDGTVQPDSPGARKREYTRHCFVLTRAAVQFWKFARFVPGARPLTSGELAYRIRQVTGRSVWLDALPPEQQVVFPGYANLREISAAHPGAFQANIGAGWPVYFRAGNMPIVMPMGQASETKLNGEIMHDLGDDVPTIVWLYNFPSLSINHVVVIFAGYRDANLFHYTVYDPNYADAAKKLTFNLTTRTFSYQPTFFFKGGEVTARAIYRGVLQ
jgi:hypothetical protein